MHKKYHKKFKILDILAVTTQAREGIETSLRQRKRWGKSPVTTQAREGIETNLPLLQNNSFFVTTQAREGIEGSSACPRQKSINFIKVL